MSYPSFFKLFLIAAGFVFMFANAAHCQYQDLEQKEVLKKDKRIADKFRISTRIGFSSLIEMTGQLEYKRKEKWGGILSLGYRYGINDLEGNQLFIFCSSRRVLESIAKRGLVTNIGVSLRTRETETKARYFYFTIDYRRMKSLKVKEDTGCFSGFNGADYNEFKINTNEYGVKLWIDFHKKNRWVNPYLGIGMSLGDYTRRYSREGTYSDMRPSDRVEREQVPLLRFDIGVRI